MAQDGPHGHQAGAAASDDHHSSPPAPVTYALMSPGPYDNGGSSSAAGDLQESKGKNAIPDLNKEQIDSAAAGSDAGAEEEGSKGKGPAAVAAEPEVAADFDAASNGDSSKGKSVAGTAAGHGELRMSIIVGRERRRQMNDRFKALHSLMSHLPSKVDKAGILGEAVHYIGVLEEKKAMLEKRKQEKKQALGIGEQAAAVVADPLSTCSSSLPAQPQPQTAHGMAALSSGHISHGWLATGAPPPLAQEQQQPPAASAAAAGVAAAPPVQFRTWSAPNVVLTVANDSAYISVCAPHRPNTLTTVLSVLNNHGIDVVTAQIASDSARSLFIILARMTGTGGENNPSAEEVFQMAVSEIVLYLNSN